MLLCSDGLTNMVEDEDIFAIIRSDEPIDETVHMLIDTANENGGRDNIAVLIVEL